MAYPHVWRYPSLAEVLLRSDAGALAAFMPTSVTTTPGQQILDTTLFEAIFTADVPTLGQQSRFCIYLPASRICPSPARIVLLAS